MGGKLLKIRKGDIGEYLANLILSEIAFTTFIPRQEDFGIDFYCGLMRKVEDKLYFDLPFLLQIKTNREPITYGILKALKKKKDKIEKPQKRWDKETIDSLFNLNLPFFIGFIDSENLFLDIHSTSLIWKIQREYKNPASIEFRFPEKIDIEKECQLNFKTGKVNIPNFDTSNNDGYKHIIDLGQPILRIEYNQLKENSQLENYTKILRKIIVAELKNITFKINNLPYFKWVHKYKTNSDDIIFGWNVYEEKEYNKPIELVNDIREHLLSLAVGLKENNMDKEYEALCKITNLITKKDGFDNLLDKYKELIIEK